MISAFLLVSQCVFGSCAPGEKVEIPLFSKMRITTPAARILSGENSAKFDSQEIKVGQRALNVYQRPNENWAQIQTKEGKPYWIYLPKVTQAQFLELDEVLKHSPKILLDGRESMLRQGDLVSPFSNSKLSRPARLGDRWVELPVGFLDISIKCADTDLAGGHFIGRCRVAPDADFYEAPSNSSKKILSGRFDLSYVLGFEVASDSEIFKDLRLLVFEERKKWVKVRLAYQPESLPEAWIPLKRNKRIRYQRLSQEEARRLAEESLSSEANRWAQRLSEPYSPKSFFATGKVKREGSQLWFELLTTDGLSCPKNQNENLTTAWLPALEEKGKLAIDWNFSDCQL